MLYTYFDVETSGLDTMNDDVLSFSYMLADENLRVMRAETLYFWKEGVTKWSQQAYEVHGLSKEFLRQYADDYDKNLRKMYIAMSYSALVGFNSGWIGNDGLIHGFDYSICKQFLIRNGLYEPKVLEFNDVMKMAGRRIKCTALFDKLGLSRELAEAYTNVYFGEDAKAHNSAYDVVMTAMEFQAMYSAANKGIDMTYEMDSSGDSEYKLEFNDEGALLVRDAYTDEVVTIDEFKRANITMFTKMMENPAAYM